jgi:hypothetical protein
MSGCYRCGLPEGSESRLCETCFSHRFNHGEPVLSGEGDQAAEGPEFTPSAKRWLLSGGAAIYIGVVGLGLLVQGERLELRRNAHQPDILRYGANEFPVEHRTEVVFLAGPLGDKAVE